MCISFRVIDLYLCLAKQGAQLSFISELALGISLLPQCFCPVKFTDYTFLLFTSNFSYETHGKIISTYT